MRRTAQANSYEELMAAVTHGAFGPASSSQIRLHPACLRNLRAHGEPSPPSLGVGVRGGLRGSQRVDPSASHRTRGVPPQHWGTGLQPPEGRDAGAPGWDPCFPGKVGGCSRRAHVWGLAVTRASRGARPRARIPRYCAESGRTLRSCGRGWTEPEEPAARRRALPGRLAPLPPRGTP